MSSLHSMNTVSLWEDEEGGRMDSYDRCTPMWMFLMLLNYIFKVLKTNIKENSYNGEFYVYFYHNKVKDI